MVNVSKLNTVFVTFDENPAAMIFVVNTVFVTLAL